MKKKNRHKQINQSFKGNTSDTLIAFHERIKLDCCTCSIEYTFPIIRVLEHTAE